MIALNNTELALDLAWLGTSSFHDSLQAQDKVYRNLLSDQQNFGTVFGLQHPAVITLGKRGDVLKDVLDSSIEVVEVDRGGQATLHSPGQLVIYPVLHLRRLKLGVRQYVEALEQTTIWALQQLGIEAFTGPQAGVFTARGKIAFVGVRVRQGVSTHGISINFSNDLQLFKSIRPCGLCEASLDQVQNYVEGASLSEFFQVWARQFRLSLLAKAGNPLES